MNRRVGSDEPTMLMLSCCVPDAAGPPQRARAWQLLRLASQSHRVHLAAIADGPVSLAQWRSVAACAHRVVIEPVPTRCRWTDRCIRRFDIPADHWLALSRALIKPMGAWLNARSFDAVLCTHPGLWPRAAAVGADLSMCDLYALPSRVHRCRSQASGGVRRRWHERQMHLWEQAEQHVACTCRILIFAQDDDLHRFGAAGCNNRLVVPEAIDLAYFTQDVGEVDAPPRLVCHADLHGTGGRQSVEWFSRRIWPAIKQAVPDAQLDRSGGPHSRNPLAPLWAASVVAAPDAEPATARLPVLQAMALCRPVVAPEPAVRNLGARHSEHLLLIRRTDQWVQHCVELLRSASARLQLAQGARDFVERHFSIEQTGRDLLGALRFGPPTETPMKRAA